MGRFSPTVRPVSPLEVIGQAANFYADERERNQDRARMDEERQQIDALNALTMAREQASARLEGLRPGQAPERPVTPANDVFAAARGMGMQTETDTAPGIFAGQQPGLAGALRHVEMPQPTREPKVVALPGSYVRGMGYTERAITDMDMESMVGRTREKNAVGRTVRDPRYDQLTDEYYLDREATPEAMAAREQAGARTTAMRALETLRTMGPDALDPEALMALEAMDVPERMLYPEEEEGPTITQAGRKFPDTPEGRAEALAWSREASAAGRDPNAGAPKPPSFSDVSGIRKEFASAIADQADIAASYAKIQEATDSPSAAGDLSLIFNYMRLLDPGSTVREGEFANAQNTGGVPDRIRATYNNIMRGERLTPEQRNDFASQANRIVGSQRPIVQSAIQRFSDMATRFGIDPRDVVFDPLAGVAGRARPDLPDDPDAAEAEVRRRMGGGN